MGQDQDLKIDLSEVEEALRQAAHDAVHGTRAQRAGRFLQSQPDCDDNDKRTGEFMEIPNKIAYAAQRLKLGHRVNRITVRDLLWHFGAERRGVAKVQAIKQALDSLGLVTEPDFELAWIDELIWIRLRNSDAVNGNIDQEIEDVFEPALEAEKRERESDDAALMSSEPETLLRATGADRSSINDPTFRIGSFPAANKPLVTVSNDAPLAKAITLMIQNEFSQLPVMQGDREARGIISWKSIGSRLARGHTGEMVGDFREDARMVDSNRTLFEVMPTIVEFGYVLVRNQEDKRINSIVTASDLSIELQSLTEPFLLLREIELHIRQILTDKVEKCDFKLAGLQHIGSREPETIDELTLGEYIRLLQHPSIWDRLALRLDSREFISLLEEVRNIRNEVMHFERDPLTGKQLSALKKAARLMQQINEPRSKIAIKA